jgi:hypothetical protein
VPATAAPPWPRVILHTVRTFGRWDWINARQRETAKESRFAACTSLLPSSATLRTSPKCGVFRIQPRGSPLRQTGCWRKEDSLPAFTINPRGKPGSRSSGACIRASLNISRLPLPFSRQLSSTTSTVVTGLLLSERRLPDAHIDKPLGRSVAELVANLDGVDLGGRRVLCPEGPASGDHFDVVSSLRPGGRCQKSSSFH